MAKAKTRAPEQTLEETRYLKYLADNRIPVCIRLSNDELIEGIVEFYDDGFIRLTRFNASNLFIYKHDIKYLYEAE